MAKYKLAMYAMENVCKGQRKCVISSEYLSRAEGKRVFSVGRFSARILSKPFLIRAHVRLCSLKYNLPLFFKYQHTQLHFHGINRVLLRISRNEQRAPENSW